MEDEIVYKITSLLNKYIPPSEEAHIVYLFVEIRKVMDRKSDSRYPLLRFYCDWTVHTKKDKITPAMKNIMEKIYNEMQEREKIKYGIISRQDSMNFLYMAELKKEMKSFLDNYGIPTQLLNQGNWVPFIGTFVKILANQPIENPCDGIKSFTFLPANEGCFKMIINYRVKEAEYKEDKVAGVL